MRCGIAAGLFALAILPPAQGQSPILLRDVTSQTGITFKHSDGGTGQLYTIEYATGGLALFDYDGDGDQDVYFLSGAPRHKSDFAVPPANALYRNDGDWRFTDVTEEAGVGDEGFGLGVTAGDYDNDGDLDLFVNNFGPNVLYRNNGDGTFTNVARQAGVEAGNQVGAGACFLDMDGDGDLDLYVANYIQFSYDEHVPPTRMGVDFYRSPKDYRPERDFLYRNNGDGTFTDASEESGVGKHAGLGMGMVAADYDNDGDTDLFVCNDVQENFFFQNDGAGKFAEIGLYVGTAYDLAGNIQGSMGVDCADYDNDGWLDFFMTDYQDELPVLYKNSGQGFFQDVTRLTGAGAGAFPHVTWGTGFADFDNDGDRDLFMACGHFDPNIETIDDTATYLAPNILLLNNGDGTFRNVSDTSGDGLQVKLSSRGAGFDDLDNDGDVDAVILNSRREPTLLRNDSPNHHHWIQIRLQGTKTNRDGVGARVKVASGDLVQIDEVHSGRGYQGHHGMRLHFGLGPRDRIDSVEVRWIGGSVDVFENVGVDQFLTLTEGAGKPPE